MKRAIVFVAALAASCTDAEYSQLSALGEPANLTCYSGTAVIYKGRSTGKLSSEGHSDGWFFTEQGTNHLIRVSGACVVTQRTSSSPVLPPIDSTCCGLLK